MTMYGQAPRGMHTAVKVLVGVAAAVVLVAAVVVWRSTGEEPEPAAGAASPPPAPSSPAVTESAAPPAELSTGSWLISLRGGTGGYLTIADDYAALSSGQRTVFAVVKGLADDSCFSVREPDGKYLRHFDYRLRFDKPEDSDLYRKDATFCPLDDVAPGTVRLRSANYPDHLIHSRADGLYIDKSDSSDAFDATSSFALEEA